MCVADLGVRPRISGVLPDRPQRQFELELVVADAFCWSMVRSLVGACLVAGQGRRPADFATRLLGETARSPLVPLAPARGLSLVGVDYPDDDQLAARAASTRAMRTREEIEPI